MVTEWGVEGVAGEGVDDGYWGISGCWVSVGGYCISGLVSVSG